MAATRDGARFALVALIAIAMTGCAGRSAARPAAAAIGGVTRLEFDDARSVAVRDGALRVHRFAREHPVFPPDVWGRDEERPLEADLEVSFPAGGETITLSRAVLEGICDVSEARWYRDHDGWMVWLHGGDAAGSYLAVFRIHGTSVDRFIMHGEMGEELCESASFERDAMTRHDRHGEYHD